MAAPFGFWDMLARKYDILQQQADADTLRAGADANLNVVRAGLMPAESRANLALSEAQRGFTIANTGLSAARTKATEEETKFIGPLAKANIGESGARARLYGSQANAEDQLSAMTGSSFRGMGWLRDNRDRIDSLLRPMLKFGLLGGEE